MEMCDWNVYGVNRYAVDIWQISVEAEGPREALNLARQALADTRDLPLLEEIAGFRIEGPGPWSADP
jgi:hypothetical protein